MKRGSLPVPMGNNALEMNGNVTVNMTVQMEVTKLTVVG